MKLLIVSTKQHLVGYGEFIEALSPLGVEARLVHDLKYCFLSESRPLHMIPLPKLLRLVKRFNPDFVMTNNIFYIPHMVKLVNQRVLFHMRGDAWREGYWDKATHPSFLYRMYKHYLETLRLRSIQKIDLILPNSKWLQKRVKHQLPQHPTFVLYVGIDADKWVPSHATTLSIKHPAVVSLFKFNIFTKVSGLLKFIRIIRKMPDVNFYFAGVGPYLNLVKKDCPPNMFLLGWIQPSDVKKLLEAGDIFIHPSGADAFPRVLKEASLMERPIIASNVGGIPEIVKDNETGFLCDLDDVDRWNTKIRFFLNNPDAAKKFGKNAREFVMKTFNWQEVAKNFLNDLKTFKE